MRRAKLSTTCWSFINFSTTMLSMKSVLYELALVIPRSLVVTFLRSLSSLSSGEVELVQLNNRLHAVINNRILFIVSTIQKLCPSNNDITRRWLCNYNRVSLLSIYSCLMLKRRKRGFFCPNKTVRGLFGFVKEGISVAGSLGFISVGSGYEFAKKKLQGAAHIALFASAEIFQQLPEIQSLWNHSTNNFYNFKFL